MYVCTCIGFCKLKPWNGTAKSKGRRIVKFSRFGENAPQKDRANLHHQQYVQAPISLCALLHCVIKLSNQSVQTVSNQC